MWWSNLMWSINQVGCVSLNFEPSVLCRRATRVLKLGLKFDIESLPSVNPHVGGLGFQKLNPVLLHIFNLISTHIYDFWFRMNMILNILVISSSHQSKFPGKRCTVGPLIQQRGHNVEQLRWFTRYVWSIEEDLASSWHTSSWSVVMGGNATCACHVELLHLNFPCVFDYARKNPTLLL